MAEDFEIAAELVCEFTVELEWATAFSQSVELEGLQVGESASEISEMRGHVEGGRGGH